MRSARLVCYWIILLHQVLLLVFYLCYHLPIWQRGSVEENSANQQVEKVNLWRNDGRCGSNHKLPNGQPSQCNPEAFADRRGPCCSHHGWCGNTHQHCKCKGCVDYRKDFFDDLIVRTKGNIRNLDQNNHVSKLVSKFSCHDKPLKLLITVISPIAHFQRRNIVRSTWGNNLFTSANDDFRVFFVVGKPYDETIMSSLMQESKHHGDIIMGDFYENYHNSFLKTDTVLEWSFKYCKFQFLLITSDNTFIHLKNLIQLLNSYGNATGLYVGEVDSLYRIYDAEMIADDTFPQFVTSSTVLFSNDVVKRFMLHAFVNPYRFPPDIYMAFIALDANLRATRNGAFLHSDGVEKCVYNEKAISLQLDGVNPRLDCMSEFYYEMLAQNADDGLIYKYYYKISKSVIDSNRQYNNMSLKDKNLYIDTRYIVDANYSNLDKKHHVGKLISKFPCHTRPLKVIVMLLSHPANYKRRNTVRTTWGKRRKNPLNEDFRVFFVVGKVHNQNHMNHVHKESDTYEDIVFGDFQESFYNNSWKIDMMMEYSIKHCEFEYLLKVDDDNFIHMSNLFKLLGRVRKKTKIYLGRKMRKPYAVRQRSKYSFTYDEYRNSRLAPFIAGGAVIMSYEAVRNILPYLFLGVHKPPMKLEDVYTGFLALNAGIPVTHSGLFKHSNAGRCAYDRRAVSLHFWRRKETDEVACMLAMYRAMLKLDAADPFVRLHYLNSTIMSGG